ncbi:MAG: PEP-CTERM sorting domain-containing protein [Pseudomonadota bacterium]
MKKNILALAVMAACMGAVPVHAVTIDLSGAGWTTYGDGNAYSLPSSGLEVMSGPGQIALTTRLGLGANGQLGNTAGMDDAFDTPSANSIDGFRMGGTNEPGTTGSWDRVGWWDASLAAINSAVDLLKNSIVFFFANNETGSGETANLAAWSRIEVTKISTNELLGQYDLTNNGGGYGTPIAAGPGVLGVGAPLGGGVVLGDVSNYSSSGDGPGLRDFLRAGSDVCVYTAGPMTGLPVACPAVADPAITTYAHNLGGDRAAYAIVFPELDALLASLALGGDLADYAIHVDYRLGCGPEGAFPNVGTIKKPECDGNYALNGGDEKVFLGTQLLATTEQVPEPATLMLLALGLFGVAFARRARS